MRFSFVTCTYNRSNQLKKTLDSLVCQEFDTSAFQIIVINNNSTDTTQEVCNEYIRKYSGHNIEHYIEFNQGLSFALNRGIREAKGEYLIYIDDDETIESSYLSKLNYYLTKNPQIEYAASIITPIYEGGEPKWMSPFTQRLIGGYFNEGQLIKKLDKKKYPGTGHTIIKKDLYLKYGLYNTELGRKGNGLMGAEDKDMAHRLIEGGIECYYLPIEVYHHIPKYKLSDEFFSKLTYSIGKSERIRTSSISPKTYYKRLFDEVIKWGASFVLCFFYIITLRPAKGFKLIAFRWNVTRGLLLD